MTTTEVTRRASTVVEDLELWLAGGKPNHPRIAAAYGWPDVVKVRESLAHLKPMGDLPVTCEIPKAQEKPMTQTARPAGPPARTAPVRPGPPSTGPVATLSARPDSIVELLRAGHHHDLPAIRRQAEKIDALLAALRVALQADAAHAARRKEIAELEARLAELKATPSGGFPCPEGCGASFETKQGASMHRTRAHRAHRADPVPA